MNKDFQQEELEIYIDNEDHYNPYSLPPRSTIHGTKETNGGNGMKVFWVFIIIALLISAAIYFLFIMPEGKGLNIFDREKSTNEEIIDNDSSNTDLEGEEDIISNETDSDADIIQNDESDLAEQNGELTTPDITEPDSDIVPTNDQIHIIQSGENLFRISMEYYNTGIYYEALAKYNGLENSDDIYAGFKLKIPSKEVISQY